VELETKILNEEGFHARPAGVFAKVAAGFKSRIEVEFGGKVVNGKSLLSIMSLGLTKDCVFKIRAEGDDADAAIQSLGQLVNNRFA
jgi:phosphocarrier protein HPr